MSRYKDRKGYFSFNQKSVLLTYSRTDKSGVTKADLGNYLYEKFKPAVIVVCLEHHQDGHPHLHVWMEFEEKFNSRDVRVFDYKSHHPNIGVMIDKKKNTRSNALLYMTKEDDDLFAKGIDIDIWRYSCKQHKKYVAVDLMKGKKTLQEVIELCPELLFEYSTLKKNLNEFLLDKEPPKEINRTVNNLWIFGPPGCGKTYYVTHHFDKYYLKEQSKWWDGYGGQDVVLLDDYDDKSLGHYVKRWGDNYGVIGEIKNSTIPLNYSTFIITSNYLPRNLFKNDGQLIVSVNRRFNFVTTEGNFPNYTLKELLDY